MRASRRRSLHVVLVTLLPAILLVITPALRAQALHFEPGDEGVVVLPSPLPPRVTIEAWIRSDTSAQLALPIYAGSLVAPQDGYGLLIHDGYRNGAGDRTSIVVAGVAYCVTGTSIATEESRWVHVALVRSDTLWLLYRNGTLVGRGIARPAEPSRAVHVGGRFNGDVDEIRIWAGARSGEQIARTFRADVAGDAEGLIARYEMARVDGTTMRNVAATGAAYDMALSIRSAAFGTVDDAPTPWAGPAPRIALDAFPRSMQFLARGDDDSASAPIAGRVLDAACDDVRLEVLRDGEPVLLRELELSGPERAFAATPRIESALAEYTVRVSGRVDGEWRQVAEAAGIVAGDVYMIAGQSNSHPSSPLATTTSRFVRSFGVQTRNGNGDAYDPGDTLFGIANAHGFDWGFAGPYLVGVWGQRLAENLVRELGHPVLIINGGAGGSSIEQNARDDASPQNLSTIYGRTLYRFERSGLRRNVRAIIWHQGESNGIYNYAANFAKLYHDWRKDYPSASHFYVFQIRPGCGGSRHVELRELQRTIGDSLDDSLDDSLGDITALATVGLPGHDGCHYTVDGYLTMAEQLTRFVLRDVDPRRALEARPAYPDIVRAWFTSDARDEVALLFRSGSPLVWKEDTLVAGETRRLESAWLFDDVESLVERGSVRGDTVVLSLRRPLVERHVSYVPDKYYPGTDVLYEGPWLVDREGLGAFAFASIPIEDRPASGGEPAMPSSVSVAPNPTSGALTVRYAVETDSRVSIVLVDEAGREQTLMESTVSTGSYTLAVDGIAAGAYRCVVTINGRRTVIAVMAAP
jgi:hypothetical protein